MIYDYQECLKKFKTHYRLLREVSQKRLFKIDSGLYSDEEQPTDVEIFLKKHKNVIFTIESAFYYIGISDVIPKQYVIATNKDSTKYKSDEIKQYFFADEIFKIGITYTLYNGIKLPVYDKERLLIEIIRYKKKLPFDYYKEIINYYRLHIDEVDVALIWEYLENFPKKQLITTVIQMEVL